MPTRRIFLGFLSLWLALACSSCSSEPAPAADAGAAPPAPVGAVSRGGYDIERVKIERIDSSDRLGDTDKLVAFNHRRRLWGAIAREEQRARYGQYFVVDWEGPDAAAAVATIRFEYRQQKTAAEVTVLEQTAPVSGGEQFATFAVIGEDYARDGLVTAWQVSILVDGQVVATQPSFLWN